MEEADRKKTRREKLASYFFDISKLTFGGVFVAVIIPLFTGTGDLRMWMAAVFGLSLTVTSALLANKILK